MLTVPAFVWRRGPFGRAALVGSAAGVVAGALAWLESGMLLAGLLVAAIIGPVSGAWLGRRMVRYWPGAAELRGEQRERVAAITRCGGPIEDPLLARPVIDYSDGLRASAADGRSLRWLMAVILIVALGAAAWDAAFGSRRDLVSSCVYLVLVGLELFWWPGRRAQLLVRADRARDMALRQI